MRYALYCEMEEIQRFFQSMKISKLREFRDRAIDNVRLDFYPAYDAWGISFSSSPEIIYIRSTSEMSRKLREIRRNYILGQVRTSSPVSVSIHQPAPLAIPWQ